MSDDQLKTDARHEAQTEPPPCPACRRRMTLKVVAPLVADPRVDEVTYGCVGCGTEFKRRGRRG
jgi:DNA-directed RNA polymerase subunit RPC12/RpoP